MGSGQSDFDDMCSQHHEAGLNEIAFSDLLLEKQIGQGGFGKVFLAKWQGTHVAVKQVLRATQAGRVSLREEFKVGFHLRSPRIAQVLGCAFDPMANTFCLVLEYASGGSVRSRLDERGVPNYNNALQWALDVAQGMEFLHKHDAIHCDLKGANVLLAHDGTSERAKVTDFGLARALQTGRSGQSHSKDVQGSPAWMAPESINGEFTIHSDRYSYGIFLWELITAEIPWNNISPYSVLYRVTFENARPPLPQDLEHPFTELMKRCWDEDAEMRPCFSTCTQTLQAFMQGDVVNDVSQ
jgi:serine/threonine protein kinase